MDDEGFVRLMCTTSPRAGKLKFWVYFEAKAEAVLDERGEDVQHMLDYACWFDDCGGERGGAGGGVESGGSVGWWYCEDSGDMSSWEVVCEAYRCVSMLSICVVEVVNARGS